MNDDFARMRFEIWALDALDLPVTRHGDTYLYVKVREAWEAWQASRADK